MQQAYDVYIINILPQARVAAAEMKAWKNGDWRGSLSQRSGINSVRAALRAARQRVFILWRCINKAIKQARGSLLYHDITVYHLPTTYSPLAS